MIRFKRNYTKIANYIVFGLKYKTLYIIFKKFKNNVSDICFVLCIA